MPPKIRVPASTAAVFTKTDSGSPGPSRASRERSVVPVVPSRASTDVTSRPSTRERFSAVSSDAWVGSPPRRRTRSTPTRPSSWATRRPVRR